MPCLLVLWMSKVDGLWSQVGSIFNLNMSTGTVVHNRNFAETTKVKNSNTDINIVFNENYIGGYLGKRPTDLSVATTMAHEIIHAYLISLLVDNNAGGCSGICEFPTIFDAYVQYQINKDVNLIPNAHHELIAEKYVIAIASTIQEFHIGGTVVNPSQDYLDLAWGGLIDTKAFILKYPDDVNDKNYAERTRIIDRITSESYGYPRGSTMPIGTPCNK